ncbi:MAG: DHH family phosphoesterase [Bacteroidales bacterium]|nr:DHH family phosphoesterase [Bacteroidales bacterium]MDD4214804.1 DHH family phosphoesterase [Bacteroidales bacterium]
MDNTFINRVASLLKKSGQIVILTHHNPDGDAIGSSLALWFYLKKKYKVTVITPNDFPDFYKWMPGVDSIIIGEKNKELSLEILTKADLIFCLDFNTPERVGFLNETLANTKGEKILIDHHLCPSPIFKTAFSQLKTSSTAELVYDFIVAMGDAELIDYEIAVTIYVGIITDTGSFSHSCNFPKTYLAVSRLFEKNIDAAEIQRLVFGNFSESRLRLLGYCLSEKLNILNEYATSYISISLEEKKRFNFQIGDGEGIVNYGLTIKGVRLTALFSETKEYVKLSLRSSGEMDVDKLAREHFGGAGHKNAAGANIYKPLDKAIAQFISLLPLYKNYLTEE